MGLMSGESENCVLEIKKVNSLKELIKNYIKMASLDIVDDDTFLFHFEGLVIEEAVELTLFNIENNIDILDVKIDRKNLVNLLFDICSTYNNVNYHNLDHAVNTTLFGGLILKNISKLYEIAPWTKFFFIISLISHDLGHPGYTKIDERSILINEDEKNKENLTLEFMHVKNTIFLLKKYRYTIFSDLNDTDFDSNLILLTELIQSTTLSLGDMIIDEFCKKHLKVVDRKNIQIEMIDLKMFIKISDLNGIYKEYDVLRKNSESLWRELMNDNNFLISGFEIEKDLKFIRKTSLPQIKVFVNVFPNFTFLLKRCKRNYTTHEKRYEQYIVRK